MELTREQLHEINCNVDHGIEWLEENGVWVGDINPHSLQMTDACKCVVGQLVKRDQLNYYDVVRATELSAEQKREDLNLWAKGRSAVKFVMTTDEAELRGFHVPESIDGDDYNVEAWEALNAAWKDRIIKARQATGVSANS